ncbi:MAG: phenylalanine--tRNA ligase subunit alpha, partial [Gemmatimonadota bacterium]
MKSGTELVKELERLESEALDAVEKASGEEELEAVRIEYLGRSEGNVSSILRTLGELEPED